VCERCDRDGNNWWITFHARYSTTIKPSVYKGPPTTGPIKPSESARVLYENGDVKVELGGLKGISSKPISEKAKKVIEAAIKTWNRGEN
jgi:hypothetical protein